MISILFAFQGFALLALRIGVGLIFLAHGWPKIKNLKQNAVNFSMMGFKPAYFWGTIIALLEVFGAAGLIAGLFTQPFALLLGVEMIVAMLWKIRKGQKLVGGYELDMLMVLASFALATSGAGFYSLENYWQLWLL